MRINFVTEEPAVKVGDSLIITDVHIGIEYEFYKSGINLPTQTKKIRKKIESLLKGTKAKKLIILGDLTHQVPGISWQERKEIPKMMEKLNKRAEIHIIKGNHDGELETLIENDDIKIHGSKGFLHKDVAFVHGNAWPTKDQLKAKTLIMGHIHPTIEFTDHFGFRMVEKCWIRAPVNKEALAKKYKTDEDDINLEEVIVVPVFNSLIGGMAINKGKAFMGPIMKKCINKEELKAYLLDGTDLGHIKNKKS